MGIYRIVHVMDKRKAFRMVMTSNPAYYKCSLMLSLTHKGTQWTLCNNLYVPQEVKFPQFNVEGLL